MRSDTAQWLGHVQEEREGPATGNRRNTLLTIRIASGTGSGRGSWMRMENGDRGVLSQLRRQATLQATPPNSRRCGGSGSSWGRWGASLQSERCRRFVGGGIVVAEQTVLVA